MHLLMDVTSEATELSVSTECILVEKHEGMTHWGHPLSCTDSGPNMFKWTKRENQECLYCP